MLKPIETRKAAKALADCPGWADLVRPEIDRHLHKLEDDILNGDFNTKALEDKRAAYAELKTLLRDLHGYVMGSLSTLTEDEITLFPRSVREQMESLFTPPLRGIQTGTEQPLAHLEFSPAAPFNPFAAHFIPTTDSPPITSPPSTSS